MIDTLTHAVTVGATCGAFLALAGFGGGLALPVCLVVLACVWKL